VVSSANPSVAGRFVNWERATARLGSRMTTTPGRMRLAFAAIAVGLLALAVVGTGTLRARQRATNGVGRQAEPLLAGAEVIYSSLADADATATNTFLKSGLEPPDRRQTYLDDLATAANRLATVTRQAGSSTDAARAIGVITADLPTYSGLIESARANNRLGLPVGAAYLREGSTLMQTQILPAVGQLYKVEAGRLNGSYSSGRSMLDVIGVALVAALAIGALLVSQVFLARRTNRLLNPGLLGATLLAAVLLAWTLLAFSSSASRLSEARVKGSDPVQLLSSARILVSRAQVDENLALVARGSGTQYLDDLNAVTKELGPADGSSGLMREAERAVPPTSTPLIGPGGAYPAYLDTHAAVLKAETGGQFATAVDLATGSAAGDELPAASQLSTALGDRITSAQKVFDGQAAAAASDLSLLSLGVIGLVVLGAGAAFLGFEQRINEYR
jgi:hypothetical protein